MAATVLSRDDMRRLVETLLVDARRQGHDLSPTELHARLGRDHPEIAAMDVPKFSGGIVRPVKQRLNAVEEQERFSENLERRIFGETGLEGAKERLRRLMLDYGNRFINCADTKERVALLATIESGVDEFFSEINL